MDKQIEGKKMHITINVLMTVVMIVLVVLSTILFGHEDENRYALRVISVVNGQVVFLIHECI